MNGIDKIAERLNADMNAEIQRVMEAAKTEAAQVTGRYQEQADKIAADLSAKNKKAAAERQERLISAAQMEARKSILAVKQETVSEVYDRALEKLCSLPEKTYIEALTALLIKASATGDEEAIFSPKDRESVGAAAVEKANAQKNLHLTVSNETRDIQSGFILKAANVEVNCTFETLVRMQKAETAGAVAKLLFPEA